LDLMEPKSLTNKEMCHQAPLKRAHRLIQDFRTLFGIGILRRSGATASVFQYTSQST
jgi:hypothetical protein